MSIAILKTQGASHSPNMRYQENSTEFSQMPNGTSDNVNIMWLRPNFIFRLNAWSNQNAN